MPPSRRFLIGIPLAMAVALTATVLSGFFLVRTVRTTLLRGQADAIVDQIRRASPRDAEWDQAGAEEILAELAEDGVLCFATFDETLAPVVVAGSCPAPTATLREALLGTEPGEVLDLGSRVRVVRRPPEHWRRRLAAEKRESPEERESPGPPRPRAMLLEFEPRLSSELEASAVRTLGVGGAASLALLATAVVFWRLSLRAERLQEALERDRRLAALGEMAAVLSHEMRNPLTSMKGHAQLLAESLAPGTRERDKADRVVGDAVRLEKLTADLLTFVRARRIRRTDVDPAAVLREAAVTVDESRCDLELAEAPARWSLDPGMLHQALANLLRNALQASPDEARVTASVGREGEELVFAVRDRGEGIPESAQGRIFEPFHTTRVRGTGLGLTVARRIVELHGGTLTPANHPQGGAVFRAAIPQR